MEYIKAIDLWGMQVLNQQVANPFLDFFFPRMAAPIYFYIPLGLLALLLLFRGGVRARVFLVVMGITIFVGDALIVASLKKITNRPRPHEAVEGVRRVTKNEVTIAKPTTEVIKGRSFPSGHVCNNVAIAVVVVFFYGKRWRWLYGWALLMGWNRIYLGSHYPSDVIGSWVIALGYAFAILGTYRLLLSKTAWYFERRG